MSMTVNLTAADGFEPSAYTAIPATSAPRGGVVVLQEFFGVNRHIRNMADLFAAQGYAAVAPALFDRLEPGVELDYSDSGMEAGRRLRSGLVLEQTLHDVQAAIDWARLYGAVAVVGYCWGGSLAFLSAARLTGAACAVGYYGAQIAAHASEPLKIPVQLHYAETDEFIPPADIDRVRSAHPEVEVFVYPRVHHGFNCDARRFYDAAAAAEAQERTDRFIGRHVG